MSPETISGIQACLALEHEAIWVYGFLGGRVEALRETARESFDDHRVTRDKLIGLLDAAGATRPVPLATYDVEDVANAKEASAVARALEDKGVAAWLAVVGTSEGKDRAYAIAMMRTSALAAMSWDGTPTPFPGLPT